MTYTISTTLNRPYDDAVREVRAALGDQGSVADNPSLHDVAVDAKQRITAALASLRPPEDDS